VIGVSNSKQAGEDGFLRPGTKVRRDTGLGDDINSEFGVIVHCWWAEELGCYDCLVAMFGDAFPQGEPDEKPAIFRYAAMGMSEIPID